MVKQNLAELNKSLKQAFSDVARDMIKLKDRDERLREEISKIARELNYKIDQSEIDNLSKKITKSLENVATKNELKKSETEIKAIIEKAISIPDSRATKIENSVATMDNDLNQMEADVEQRLKEIKNEFSRVEVLEKGIKEIDTVKKSINEVDKKFADIKTVQNNQHDIEEIYQILDAMESTFVNKDEIERVRKDVQKRLKRFEEKIKDTEDTEEELARKTKDIYEIERNVQITRKEMIELRHTMKSLDNTEDIQKSERLTKKEIDRIDARLDRHTDSIRGLHNKINSLIKVIENSSKFPAVEISSLEKIRKEPISKKKTAKVSKSYQDEEDFLPRKKNKSLWIKIADWFTEEVEEETPELETKKQQKVTKQKPTKKENELPKMSSEEEKSKKSFAKKVVDWLTEEIDDEPKQATKQKETKKQQKVAKEKPEQEEKEKKSFFKKAIDWLTEEIDDEE